MHDVVMLKLSYVSSHWGVGGDSTRHWTTISWFPPPSNLRDTSLHRGSERLRDKALPGKKSPEYTSDLTDSVVQRYIRPAAGAGHLLYGRRYCNT